MHLHVLQTELDPISPVTVQELDRKPSSCPYLFTWNGSRFEFITDFLGGGEIGDWEAPGRFDTPDPDEYVRLAQEALGLWRELEAESGETLLELYGLVEVVRTLEESTAHTRERNGVAWGRPDPEEAVRTLRVLDALARSAQEEREIDV